jgi:GT2 family glycosyltransferase
MISVIIPTYKNKDLFIKNLKSNLRFLEKCEIIIVNDDPHESLKSDLKNFNEIVLLENKTNQGFSGSINRGVKAAHGKYILLINSDVKILSKSFNQALEYFKKNKNLFAVSFAQVEKNGEIVGKNKFYWKNGLFFHSADASNTFGKNGWAEGGACIINKAKFQKIGGFDELYRPFYWEDIDLSYRAAKSGYEVLFDPETKVIHYHESTIGKYFSKNFVKTIAFRNQFIFIWKNITDRKLFINHLLMLLPNILHMTFIGELFFLKGFLNALLISDKIVKKRQDQKKSFIIGDLEVLNKFNE